MPTRMFFVALVLILLGFLCLVPYVDGRDWVLQLEHDGQQLEGDAIHWTERQFFLLGRDGKLWEFDNSQAPNAKMVKKPFHSYSQSELRASLQREYGAAYEVSGTGHFLVVHPAGQRDLWASRFEELYREMVHYFTSCGIQVHAPEFPLVAVVFPTQAEFFRNAKSDGMRSSGMLGYYSSLSNRIMLYDQSGGRGGDWRETAATVVHEAAHQTAFNTGIHSRWANPPRWVCEGLATLFEAPGVNNSDSFRDLEDRVNRLELASYLRYFPEGLPDGMVKALVASDATFRRAPLPSYAVSWGLTFMLSERQPSQLAEYLSITANKPGFFQKQSAKERLADFQRVFGDDFEMLQSRLDRYLHDMAARQASSARQR